MQQYKQARGALRCGARELVLPSPLGVPTDTLGGEKGAAEGSGQETQDPHEEAGGGQDPEDDGRVHAEGVEEEQHQGGGDGLVGV